MMGLDYETFSDVDLKKHGVPNYVASPRFRPLIASVVDDHETVTYDFVFDVVRRRDRQEDGGMDAFLAMMNNTHMPIVAHNAPFERAVTATLPLTTFNDRRFIDSATYSRAVGAGSKLEVASRHLTEDHKLEVGAELIQIFCVPNSFYPEGPTPELIMKHEHMGLWMKFIEYCEADARGGLSIYEKALEILGGDLLALETEREYLTHESNSGWAVDLDLVRQMKIRAWANNIIAQKSFGLEVNEDGEEIIPVNFNSPKQLKEFCEQRGVQVKSLDKYHLPIVLERVKKRIEKNERMLREDGRDDYPAIETAVTMLKEVESLLETKLEIGGSTLSKLPVILNLTDASGLLKDQYVHVGAGQTYRTTGRGVQMQNIKKLDGNIRDTRTIFDYKEHWSNGDMAGQLRQVFVSSHSEGRVIVGDFKAVESRGLAYIAGEEWKLDAYREGLDVYKVLVTKYLGIDYDDVTDELRPRGKYSELSCGYQASAQAVQDFMFRLGFVVPIEDAIQNVQDWRTANPRIVDLWGVLDNLLKFTVMMNESQTAQVGNGLSVRATPFILKSMHDQHPGSVSLKIELLLQDGTPFVTRFVHGCYFRENTLCYYKPAERISEDTLWRATYRHPKTGRQTYYSIYGGKLTGILTQSFCRELFFNSLAELSKRLEAVPNARICGQFHDEINVDWVPGEYSLEAVEDIMREAMSHTIIPNFPLDVDVKSAYRYIK